MISTKIVITNVNEKSRQFLLIFNKIKMIYVCEKSRQGAIRGGFGMGFFGDPQSQWGFFISGYIKKSPGMGIGDSRSPKIPSEKIPDPGDGDLGSFRLKNPQKIPN